jgi:hypothetical protein
LLIGRRECQLRGQSFTRSFLLPFRFWKCWKFV